MAQPRPAGDRSAEQRASDGGDGGVPGPLASAAAWSWRLLVVGVVGWFVLKLLTRLEFVVIALFVGLVVTALVLPLSRFLDRFLPTWLAVALGILALVLVVAGVFAFIGGSVAGEWSTLSDQFREGAGKLVEWGHRGPLHLSQQTLTGWYDTVRHWLTTHRTTIAAQTIAGAGTLLELLTGLALALFSSVFFLSGGPRIWDWTVGLFPHRSRGTVDRVGTAAWATFAGYTRGIVIVAASNGVLVLISLLVLRVPLALPLALLVFFGTFIPIIGAPVALFVAAVVALAARGPVVALVVVVLVVVIGQVEGHVLQPLVMSRAVSIHPLAVAVVVAAGTVLAGVIGAVLAVPITAVLHTCAKELVAARSSALELPGQE